MAGARWAVRTVLCARGRAQCTCSLIRRLAPEAFAACANKWHPLCPHPPHVERAPGVPPSGSTDSPGSGGRRNGRQTQLGHVESGWNERIIGPLGLVAAGRPARKRWIARCVRRVAGRTERKLRNRGLDRRARSVGAVRYVRAVRSIRAIESLGSVGQIEPVQPVGAVGAVRSERRDSRQRVRR